MMKKYLHLKNALTMNINDCMYEHTYAYVFSYQYWIDPLVLICNGNHQAKDKYILTFYVRNFSSTYQHIDLNSTYVHNIFKIY